MSGGGLDTALGFPAAPRKRSIMDRFIDFIELVAAFFVDLVWANVNERWQRYIDVFATLILLFVVTVQTYTLFDKVVSTYRDNVLTFDLRLPTWPFFLVAWLGDVSAVLLIAIRTYRLVFHPEEMEGGSYRIKPVE